MCLIGASGSGKTTLLRCINQLAVIDSGGIWLDGELLGVREQGGRLHRLSEREIGRQRLKTGMVFQRFNLFPHKTALENIIEGPLQVQGRKVRRGARRGARTAPARRACRPRPTRIPRSSPAASSSASRLRARSR